MKAIRFLTIGSMSKRSQDQFSFLAYLDDLVSELHRKVPEALKEFDAEAIHDARVATRRLKAAMDLQRFVLSDDHRKPFEKALKKLRKRLGPLRDLDVMIEHLDELSSNVSHGPATNWLRDRLTHQRDDAREKAGKDAAPADMLAKIGAWWAVREEIVEAREAIDSLLAESLHLQLDAFTERAEQIGSPDAREGRDPHQLRIAGKLLRYTLELAQAQGHKLPGSVLRGFKKMQEALGNWHDYVVLVQCAMRTSIDEAVAYHDLEMQERLLELCRLFMRRSARELTNFSKQWGKRGAEVARTIREKFPLTRPITEPQTGPGPSGSGDTPAPVAPPPDVASTA